MSEETYVQKARREKMEKAHDIGIDDALISNLVETFYGHIQTHIILGPIFASKIDDWEPHLARMKDFWASIMLESGRYHGNPMSKHLAIDGLQAEHFDAWLSLWGRVVDEVVMNEAAADMFKDRARRIAKSIKIGTGLDDSGFGVIKGIENDA